MDLSLTFRIFDCLKLLLFSRTASVPAMNVCDIGHALPVDVLCILETFI